MRKTDVISIALMFAGAVLTGSCLLYIGMDTTGRRTARDEYRRDAEKYRVVTSDNSEGIVTTGAEDTQMAKSEETDAPVIDWSAIAADSSGAAAWLRFDDAGIDLPVASDPDGNGRYLHETLDGAASPSGCLFITEVPDQSFSGKNTIIYGHNMRDGTMFGSLKELLNKKTDVEMSFTVSTKDGETRQYGVFGICITGKYTDLYCDPVTDDEYDRFIREISICSSYKGMAEVDADTGNERPRVVTLSTCYGSAGTDRRLLVFGREAGNGQ